MQKYVIWLLLQILLTFAYTNNNLHYLHHTFIKTGVFCSIKLLLSTQTLAGDCNRQKNHVGESEDVFHFVKQPSLKPIISQLVNKNPAFCETRKFFTVFIMVAIRPYITKLQNSVNILTSLSLKCFNINTLILYINMFIILI
jgi:hypothetical protein